MLAGARLTLERRWRGLAAVLVRGDILFVSGPGGEARRYRCDNQREQVALGGARAAVVYRDGVALERLTRFRCVVLYRVPWDDGVARLLDAAREAGTTVLADVDDLVFDPERVHLIRGRARMAERERDAYDGLVAGLRRTLAEVDGVVVSTEPLRVEAHRLNARVGVAFNAVSAEMLALGDRARNSRNDRPGVTIAYLSGTPTHDEDFLEAADAVLSTLERFPDVRFLAVGQLTLDGRFDAFGERVVRLGAVPWTQLPGVLARVDVNLAPLERANAFTEAKSCIKYLEAGLVGVPTVASPRADFARAIEHGENGLLADDSGAWREALSTLVESPERRALVGRAAYSDVRARHTTATRAEETSRVLASLAPSLERLTGAS